MPRELITVQLGHYANFVGAHFWNLQEASFSYNPKHPTSKEVDLNILHREGQTLKGDATFTPRAIVCDYKGALKSLRSSGGIYNGANEDSVPEWNGKISEEKSEKAKSNRFLDEVKSELASIPVVTNSIPKRPRHADYELEKCVEVWSDFLGVTYHPRTLTSLENYWMTHVGVDEWKNARLREELENNTRFFVEECDNLQGFQFLVDAHDGFSGLGSSFLDYVSEEYQSKSKLVYPLYPTPLPESNDIKRCSYRLFNYALSLAGSSQEHSHTAYVPLSTTGKLYRPAEFLDALPLASFQQISYHTSAVLAGAVDSVCLLNRLSAPDEFVHLRDIVDAITVHQRQVAAMSTMLPFPLHESNSLFSALKAIDADYLPVTSLTPHVKTPLIDSQNRCYSQVMSLRGIPRERWQCSTEEVQSHRLSYEVASMSATRLFENFMSSYCPQTFGIGRVVEFPMHTQVPYPQFFAKSVTRKGFVDESQQREDDVVSLAVMAGIHSTDKVKDLLKELTDFCKKQNFNKLSKIISSSIESDEYKESFERLKMLQERYREDEPHS